MLENLLIDEHSPARWTLHPHKVKASVWLRAENSSDLAIAKGLEICVVFATSGERAEVLKDLLPGRADPIRVCPSEIRVKKHIYCFFVSVRNGLD